jgi:hypothetical protein
MDPQLIDRIYESSFEPELKPAHAPGRINAMEGNGAHALSLEIVAILTL